MNEPITIKLRYFRHHNEPVVGIYLPYDRDLIDRIKKHLPARWNHLARCWMVSQHEFNLQQFRVLFENVCILDEAGLAVTAVAVLPEGYVEKLLQKHYSDSTAKTYCHYFKEYQHESSETTEIYTHVSQNSFTKFKNPIDDLNFDDG